MLNTPTLVNVEMDRRIARSALKHGVSEEDITHALDHALHFHELENGLTMVVGPGRNGAFLEVGLSLRADRAMVVHAMRARLKFVRSHR